MAYLNMQLLPSSAYKQTIADGWGKNSQDGLKTFGHLIINK